MAEAKTCAALSLHHQSQLLRDVTAPCRCASPATIAKPRSLLACMHSGPVLTGPTKADVKLVGATGLFRLRKKTKRFEMVDRLPLGPSCHQPDHNAHHHTTAHCVPPVRSYERQNIIFVLRLQSNHALIAHHPFRCEPPSADKHRLVKSTSSQSTAIFAGPAGNS